MNKIIQQITSQTSLPENQAWWLLEFVTDKTRSQLQFLSPALTNEQQKNLENYIQELAQDHKPLAYILGWIPFLDLTIKVAPPTLIPRPETEFWVNKLIELLKITNLQNINILDIGTGSGCIALSLAQAFPAAQVYAVDIAKSALNLAQKNAKLNNITNVTFLQSNLFDQLPQDLKFDLIVSNPPYIPATAQLENSVLQWEDHSALFAPNQGLQIIEQILAQAPARLKKNNDLKFQIVMEIDASHGDAVKNYAQQSGFTNVHIKKDQFDRDRTLWA